MGRFETVDPRSGGEDFKGALPKMATNPKKLKIAKSPTKQAGSECTLSKPLSYPNNRETLKQRWAGLRVPKTTSDFFF